MEICSAVSHINSGNDNKSNEQELPLSRPSSTTAPLPPADHQQFSLDDKPLQTTVVYSVTSKSDECNENNTINNITFVSNANYESIDQDQEEEEEATTMKLVDSINDLNQELLFDSGLVHLACSETIQMSQIASVLGNSSGGEIPAIVLIPLSASFSSQINPVEVLKQHINRTGETVFREDLVAIFVYIIRSLRFSKCASLHFIIDARQMSTDDQKAALDVILHSTYTAALAFPDHMIDIQLLVVENFDWLENLIQSFRKRNARYGAKLLTISPPHAAEELFDTDAQAKCRKYFTQWLDFRQLIEQLGSLNDHVSHELDTLVASLGRELSTPVNVEGVDKQIEEHQRALKDVFKSDEFLEFQETAESDLQQLNEIATNLSNQLPDCVNFYRSLQNRQKAIQEQLSRVVCTSKMRLNSRLELKQILRLTADITREISWLNTEACSILEKLETPILSSKDVDQFANGLADFGATLAEHLDSVGLILNRVREAIAFNGHADKKLSPLADLLRVASDSTRDRMTRVEQKAGVNAELICKIDMISQWCLETINFLSTLELSAEGMSPSVPSNNATNHPLHLLVQSASRVAQYKLDRPDPVKNLDEFFGKLFELCDELNCEDLTKRLNDTREKYNDVLQLFHSKEERLDAALKQLLKLPSVSSGSKSESTDSSPLSLPRTTIAQLRLQRRILRSVNLLEKSGENSNNNEPSTPDSTSVHGSSSEDENKSVDVSASESTGSIVRHRLSVQTTPSSTSFSNRRSVAVLKALDEINEHLLEFERSTCENCSSPQTLTSIVAATNGNDDLMLPYSPVGLVAAHRSSSNGTTAMVPSLPLATDPVVMRRRASAAFSSSSSSASCSTCRKNQNRQSTITSSISPSHSGTKRFSLHQQSKSNSVLQQQQHPQQLIMQTSVLLPNQNHHQCLMPMSVKDEQIVAELLQTECDYINSLKYVIDNYLVPLTQDCRPHPLQGRLNIVFGNIESLLDFHETLLLPELELCRHNLFLFATCFLRAEQELSSLYVYYNTNKSRSDRLLAENGALFSSIQARLGHKLDVASYLLKPVQRLAKYSQFLRQLLCGRSLNDVAHGQLMLAERMLSYILRHGNDLLLLEQLRGYDFALAEQGQLLRQDKMMVERKGKSRKLRHLFLFEEILVISKIHRLSGRSDFYEYKESVKICDIGLTPLVGRSGTKFEVWFRRPNSGYRYIIKAETSAMRLAWTTDIEELLWRQAVAVKERRAAQFVSMGIGLRGLISLQPSSNNISSRTVNFASPNPAAAVIDDAKLTTKEQTSTYRRPTSVMVLSSSANEPSSLSSNINGETPAIHHTVTRAIAIGQNKRPYSWLSSSSSGTQSSSANTPAPVNNSNNVNAVSNNLYSAPETLTSPLLSSTSSERLLIPKLITMENGKDVFDLEGQLFNNHNAGELISIKTQSDDEMKVPSDADESSDNVQKLVYMKTDEMDDDCNANFEIVHCTPCSVK